jgi:hypothetical protein
MSSGVRRFRHPGRRSLVRRCPRLIVACAAVASGAVIVACGSSGGEPDPDAGRTAISFPAQTAPARTAPATTASTPTTSGGRTAPLPGQTTTAESAPGQPKQLPPAPAPAPGAPAPPAPPPPAPPAGRAGVFLIGDSLAVAITPSLPSLLPGWRVAIDGLGGRPLVGGMQILQSTKVPQDGSVVLAFSLYTNDDPRNVPALRAAIRTSLDRAGPRGCVIWATIFRAPIGGHSYGPANAAMRRMARDNPRRMRLVDWEAKARAEPALIGPDGIHPTPAGVAIRSQMYADAARSCPPVQSS